MKSFLVLATLTFSSLVEAGPYKIIVFADEGAVARAEEYKTYLLAKPPFSEMGENLNIEIKSLTKEEMGCSKHATLDRIVTCNESDLLRKQSAEGGQLSVAFTSAVTGGGAGGTIPVATIDYPIETMLHEMLHYYGINDEYAYETQAQFDAYCTPEARAKWPNSAFFNPAPPYTDDPGARSKHASAVGWMGSIPADNLILNEGVLGSKSVAAAKGTQVMGLYAGGTCEKVLGTWKPYGNSIMRSIGAGSDDTIYPYYANIIREKITAANTRIARGERTPPPEVDCDHSLGHEVPIKLHKDVTQAVKKVIQ